MKKIIVTVICIGLLYSCSDNKEKKSNIPQDSEQNSNLSGSSSEDNTIKEWLQGKEWGAESTEAPFSVLKVHSLDSCSYAKGKKHHWTFVNGEFENFGATWPLKKVNDTTFTIYVKPTQKTFTYKFVNNL